MANEFELLNAVWNDDFGYTLDLLKRDNTQINKASSNGWTPLYRAVTCNYSDIVDLLIDYGADVNQPTRTGTPLHVACTLGYVGFAQLLIENGADVNIKNWLEITPLHFASITGKLEIIRLLIRNGVNLDMTTKCGKTAYDLAMEKSHHQCARILRVAKVMPTLLGVFSVLPKDLIRHFSEFI